MSTEQNNFNLNENQKIKSIPIKCANIDCDFFGYYYY